MKKLIFAFLMGIVVLASGCETKTEVHTEKTLSLNGIAVHYFGASLEEANYLTKEGSTYTVGLTSSYKSAEDIEPSLRFYLSLMVSKMSQDIFGGARIKLQVLDEEGNVLFSAESEYLYVNSGTIYV